MNHQKTDADNIILNKTEEELLLDHNYDGIEEFDYPLPSWWSVTFIGGVVFAIFYIYFYNFAGAPSLKEEYIQEMSKVNAILEEQRKLTGNFDIEEYNAWAASADADEMANTVFQDNCASCHLEGGTGDIGPNLTDSYWLNLKEVSHGTLYGFIRVGNEDNGMPAWQDLLTKEELFAAVTFLMKLKNTNQPGKEPQGEKVLK